MKTKILFLLFSAWMVCPLKGQNTTDVDTFNSIMATPSREEREHKLNALIDKNRQAPNEQLRTAVRERLLQSFDASCSVENRQDIATLAGILHDPKAMPILIQHLTDSGPPHLTVSGGGHYFVSAWPYANGLTYFKGSEAINPLLDAVVQSKDPLFSKVALDTIGYMDSDVENPVLDRASTVDATDANAKLINFMAEILVMKEEGISRTKKAIDDRIATEKDPVKRQRLEHLKTVIAGLKGYAP